MEHARITVYEKPTCSTCRKLHTILTEQGIDFERVNYYVKPLTKDLLRTLLSKAGLEPRDLLRQRAPQYQALGLADASIPPDRLLELLVQHPDLVQRPIVVKGGRAVLARPAERVRELFEE